MKVLVTGANGYIGTKLIVALLDAGHNVVCLVRDEALFRKQNPNADRVTIVIGDLLRNRSIAPIPTDIDAAYYLVNAMIQTSGFAGLEALVAQNFLEAIDNTNCKQIISLSDIDDHLTAEGLSRQHVENILCKADAAITILKTTMIIGPGSVANELMDGLTKKMPIIIANKWSKAQEQPIAVSDVIKYLIGCLLNKDVYDAEFHISGPDVMTFKQMLSIYGDICRRIKTTIVTVPEVSSALSSYWLNYLTPISYSHAKTLVENLKYDLISRDDAILNIVPMQRLNFKQALQHAG
ncbi:NAD(P)H-binding protein [Mucilaginibacter ginkgonis]|uniref:NAD(P)H-binding protein n=1 Tax=Mucilaginibacter ginkgonis TaxID=2682091 RepID=A0A6I4HUU4_9SPHI|nr:NAD(P)H-binding protein [Mucilaginibacter ginkgonis]QQL50097.1 NAD(P)H-binding protein [Mucilaginibacter ginkgonis]